MLWLLAAQLRFWRWGAGRQCSAAGIGDSDGFGGVGGIILSVSGPSLNEFTTPSRSTDHAAEKIGKCHFLSLQSITAKKFKCR